MVIPIENVHRNSRSNSAGVSSVTLPEQQMVLCDSVAAIAHASIIWSLMSCGNIMFGVCFMVLRLVQQVAHRSCG